MSFLFPDLPRKREKTSLSEDPKTEKTADHRWFSKKNVPDD